MPGQLSALFTCARRLAASLVIGATLLTAQSAEARWLRAESPLFEIYSEGKEAELRSFTQKLEEYDGLLRTLTGTTAPPPATKLPIYLVENNEQLREVASSASADVQGLYLALPSGTLAIAVREDIGGAKWLSAQSIIFHEYTHHFMYQYFPANYPGWVTEGLAEYFSTAAFKKDHIEVGKFQLARVYPLRTRPWMPVSKLFNPPRGGGGLFYPLSWLTTHYIMDDRARQIALTEFLKDIGRGVEPENALKARFGMSVTGLNAEMKRYLKKGEIIVRAIPRNPAMPEITITKLPASADAFLLSHARFMADSLMPQDHIDQVVGEKVLTRVRRAAEKFPGDALAARTLAAGEMLYGDLDAADRTLDALIASAPDDVDALYLKAARYVIEGRRSPAERAVLFAQAMPYAAAIDKLDPNNYPALYIYALGALASGKPPSGNTLNVLRLANHLAPQVDEISLEAAVALSRVDRPSDARRLLEMVAYGSHITDRSAYARRLLKQVSSGKSLVHTPGEIPQRQDRADKR